ncbi:hypothetical protein KCP76_07495 [Salmonella enterica subsp. enterica serovar Weltevreden]|nr:hypothetical protein KCP76_07495 [Salmonella enterica subsp. enterica serovar Weltevreden]
MMLADFFYGRRRSSAGLARRCLDGDGATTGCARERHETVASPGSGFPSTVSI